MNKPPLTPRKPPVTESEREASDKAIRGATKFFIEYAQAQQSQQDRKSA